MQHSCAPHPSHISPWCMPCNPLQCHLRTICNQRIAGFAGGFPPKCDRHWWSFSIRHNTWRLAQHYYLAHPFGCLEGGLGSRRRKNCEDAGAYLQWLRRAYVMLGAAEYLCGSCLHFAAAAACLCTWCLKRSNLQFSICTACIHCFGLVYAQELAFPPIGPLRGTIARITVFPKASTGKRDGSGEP